MWFNQTVPWRKRQQNDVTNTRYSQAVSDLSTNPAWPWLTSVIRRELVLSWQYGRWQVSLWTIQYIWVINMVQWSRGIILPLGARGPRFKSRLSPCRLSASIKIAVAFSGLKTADFKREKAGDEQWLDSWYGMLKLWLGKSEISARACRNWIQESQKTVIARHSIWLNPEASCTDFRYLNQSKQIQHLKNIT